MEACRGGIDELDRSAQEKLRLADLWSFQRKEIEAVAPQPGEDAELENERRVLRNVVRLQELAGGAYAALYEDPESATAQVGWIAKRLEELARIDESAQEMLAQIQPATIALQETAHSLRHYLGKLEADPGRLDEVENRLAALEKLKRKYGASVEQVLAFLEEVRTNLAAVENADDRRNALQKEVAAIRTSLRSRGQEALGPAQESRGRPRQACRAGTGGVGHGKDPHRDPRRAHGAGGMVRARDRYRCVPDRPQPGRRTEAPGQDRVRRRAVARGSGAQDLRQSSRQEERFPRTLVFDEVDAGVGGSAAEAVGRRLKKLSGSNQVICVTHLPQIAGFADHHYFVEKHSEHGRTVASIEELAPDARTREIGRMLSGERITQEALRHAEQLLKMAAK